MSGDVAARLDRARRNLAALESSPHRDVLGKQIANARELIARLESEMSEADLWAVIA